MSGERNRFGLVDAMPANAPADDFRRSVHFQTLTGIAITRLWNGDWFYAVDTTAASRTVTLPDVGDEAGHHHIVKRITGGTNECNIVADDASAIIDGSATHSIAAQYGVRCYFSDGVTWQGTLAATGAPVDYPWTAYTPTLIADTGTITSYTASGAYIRQGRLISFKAVATITDAGTGASILNVSIPVASANTLSGAGSGFEAALTGFALGVFIGLNSGFARVAEYDGTTVIATNAVVVISGTYEA